MSYLPDKQWFVAELIEETAEEGFPRNVIHRNVKHIYANSAEDAYNQAQILGSEPEVMQTSPDRKLVKTRFWQLGELNDGKELVPQAHANEREFKFSLVANYRSLASLAALIIGH